MHFTGFARVLSEDHYNPPPPPLPLLGYTSTPTNPDSPIDDHDPDDLLFRVHDSKSLSPLQSYGFTSTDPRFETDGQPMSGSRWRALWNKKYYDRGFRSSDHTRETIIKHTLGGWPGHTGRGYSTPSSWISATQSFDWAIWEVARRLVVLRRSQVGLTLLDKCIYYPKHYRGNRSIIELVDEAIEAYGEDHGLNRDQKAALNFARASSEVAYFGRIFDKDIIYTTWWTANEPGYAWHEPFMEGYFKPRKQWSPGSWLNDLVFDPRKPFSEAVVSILDRRDQLERSRRGPRY